MKNLFLALITLSLAAPATLFAEGGSVGGGTNLVIQENDLVDFVNFNTRFGKQTKTKPFLVNPKTLKLRKQENPVFNEVKPIVDRMDNLYPGMGTVIGKAFDKPWLVVDAKFASRTDGEAKVIMQNENGIYANLDWLRSASPELVKKAYVHEGARTLARELIEMYSGGAKGPKYSALEDEITEELTPAIYGEFPTNMMAGHLKKVGELIAKKLFWVNSGVDFTTRSELYTLMKAADARALVKTACDPKVTDHLELGKASSNFIRANPGVQKPLYELATIARRTQFNSGVLLDPSAVAFVELVRRAFEGNVEYKPTASLCREKKFESFLKEFEADQGKFTDTVTGASQIQELDEVPSDDGHTSAE